MAEEEPKIPPYLPDTKPKLNLSSGNDFERITGATSQFVAGFDSIEKIRNALIFSAGAVIIFLFGWGGYRYVQIKIARETVAIHRENNTAPYLIEKIDGCFLWKTAQGINSYAVEHEQGYSKIIDAIVLKVVVFKELPKTGLKTICSVLKAYPATPDPIIENESELMPRQELIP